MYRTINLSIVVVILMLPLGQSTDSKLSEDEINTINKVSAFFKKKPSDEDQAYLESVFNADKTSAHYVALAVLHKYNNAKYEQQFKEAFVTPANAEGSSNSGSVVREREFKKMMDSAGRDHKKIKDHRAQAILLYLHFRDKNMVLLTERVGGIKLSEFFRGALLGILARK